MTKTYVFDLDGTLCTNTDGNYSEAKPIIERIDLVNQLFKSGNRIVIYTARGMGRFSNNGELASLSFKLLTEEQLNSWGVRFHDLFLGKPSGDMYIDDKAISDLDFFKIES